MDWHFCIVNLPGKPGADVCVLTAADDGSAKKAMADRAVHWVGCETLFLCYDESVRRRQSPASETVVRKAG